MNTSKRISKIKKQWTLKDLLNFRRLTNSLQLSISFTVGTEPEMLQSRSSIQASAIEVKVEVFERGFSVLGRILFRQQFLYGSINLGSRINPDAKEASN